MAVAASVRRNAEDRKIPNPSLTGVFSPFFTCSCDNILKFSALCTIISLR